MLVILFFTVYSHVKETWSMLHVYHCAVKDMNPWYTATQERWETVEGFQHESAVLCFVIFFKVIAAAQEKAWGWELEAGRLVR